MEYKYDDYSDAGRDDDAVVMTSASTEEASPVAVDPNACQLCGSKRAMFSCEQCDIKYCKDCDRKQHTGPLDKHKRVPAVAQATQGDQGMCSVHPKYRNTEFDEVCKQFVCSLCASSPQHSAHFAGRAEAKEVIARHKRQLEEQLFLLKQKVGSGVGFIRERLIKGIDTQLTRLIEGRLHDELVELREYIQKAESKLAAEVWQYKHHFEPRIAESVHAVELELAASQALILEVNQALQYGDAYLLESPAVATLLTRMRKANKLDPVAQLKALEAKVNMSDHKVFKLDGVKRALDRIYIAPPSEGTLDADKGFRAYDGGAELEVDRLDFTSINRLSFDKAAERWEKKFDSEQTIDDGEQMRAFVKGLVPLLVQDHPLLEEYVQNLFSRYGDGGSNRVLRNDVLDALNDAFDDMVARVEEVCDEIRKRTSVEKEFSLSRDQQHTIEKGLFCVAWAGYVEKIVELSLRAMVGERQIQRARQWTGDTDEGAQYSDAGSGY